MPFVKPFTPGEHSEKTYTADIKPHVLNTPDSPIIAANKNIMKNQQEQLQFLKDTQGIKTKPMIGGSARVYQILQPAGLTNVTCTSSLEAAMVVFTRLKHKKSRKRKVVLFDIKNRRRYSYSLKKKKIKREYLNK